MDQILDKVILNKEEKERNSVSFSELVSVLLSLIKAREAEILRLRYGLLNEEKHTLEDIGKKMNLTRERIRQLEKIAKKNIRAHKDFDGILAPAKHVVNLTLDEQGGLSTKERLAKSLMIDEDLEEYKKCLEFLVDNFMDEIKAVNHPLLLKGWYVHDNYLNLAVEVINEIKKLVEQKNKLIKEDEILEQFLKSEKRALMQEKTDEDLRKIINSYLDIAKDLGTTPFGQWGLNEWRSVRPKRINDKIFLVLDYYGKPMHFREIAEKINEASFDHKVAHPATIHNDLIADPRFVLIGRGVYALKDWGYKSGVVADIVADVLKENNQPLSRQEIIDKVILQRDVKANTIILALNKDARFERDSAGKFRLKSL